MKPFRLFCLLVSTLFTLSSKAGEQKPGCFEGMLHPPNVTVALPTNFVVVSASPAAKATKQFDMYEGNIWAPEKTARQFEFGAEHKFTNATEPMFFVHLSDSVAQNPGKDTFTIEKDLVKNFASAGVRNVQSKKTKWGDYPVLSLTGERPNGSAVFIAWIGINSPDGWTIFVDYRVPTGKSHPSAEEKKIWEAFLRNTKPAK